MTKTTNLRMWLNLLIVAFMIGAVWTLGWKFQVFLHIRQLSLWSVLAVFVLLAVGMYFDGSRLVQLGKMAGHSLELGQAMQVVFSNYFFALLTPGSSGGPVAQVLMLRKAGVPSGKATVLVLMRTLLSVGMLFLLLPAVLLTDTSLLSWFSKTQLALVIAAFPVLAVLGVAVLRSPALQALCTHYLGKCTPLAYRQKLIKFSTELTEGMRVLTRDKLGLVKVAGETLLSLLALYSIVPVLFAGMGGEGSWIIILGRLVLLNILLYVAPTPGGTGIAEGGFYLLFNNLFVPTMVGSVAILWRIIAEYLPFGLGMYFMTRAYGCQYLKGRLLLPGEEGENAA